MQVGSLYQRIRRFCPFKGEPALKFWTLLMIFLAAWTDANPAQASCGDYVLARSHQQTSLLSRMPDGPRSDSGQEVGFDSTAQRDATIRLARQHFTQPQFGANLDFLRPDFFRNTVLSPLSADFRSGRPASRMPCRGPGCQQNESSEPAIPVSIDRSQQEVAILTRDEKASSTSHNWTQPVSSSIVLGRTSDRLDRPPKA